MNRKIKRKNKGQKINKKSRAQSLAKSNSVDLLIGIKLNRGRENKLIYILSFVTKEIHDQLNLLLHKYQRVTRNPIDLAALIGIKLNKGRESKLIYILSLLPRKYMINSTYCYRNIRGSPGIRPTFLF